MKTVIEMAIEAGIDSWWDSGSELREVFDDHLTRFATLVKAAHVAELLEGVEMPEPVMLMDTPVSADLYTADQLRSTVAAAVLREREACAKVCENEAWRLKQIAVDNQSAATNSKSIQASNLADTIRNRSNT